MSQHPRPFAITEPLSARLGAVFDHWRGLLRGEADIPFADDVDPGAFQALCPDVFLLGAFERPLRFRLDEAATPHAPRIEAALKGRFLDEIDPTSPFEFLSAQACAAAESQAPTIYEHRTRGAGRDYGRLLLPAWGDGRVSLLIGAVEFR